jgi:predicted phosphoribosyltransferase
MLKNRIEAGQLLLEKLLQSKIENPCLFAVPRGGVIVAKPIAESLNTRIEMLVVHTIDHPLNPDVAVGAVMPDGSAVYDRENLKGIAITLERFEQLVGQAAIEVKQRMLFYVGSDQAPDVKGKTAIIVDDGVTKGYTIRTAANWIKTLEPAKIIIAIPVAPLSVVRELTEEVDEMICLVQPKQFWTVANYYEDFSQTTDEEVLEILKAINK